MTSVLQPTVVTAITMGAALLMLASGIQKRRLVWWPTRRCRRCRREKRSCSCRPRRNP